MGTLQFLPFWPVASPLLPVFFLGVIMKVALFIMFVAGSINAGTCCSKEAVQKQAAAIQVSSLERDLNNRLVRMKEIQKRVQQMSLSDLAYFKKSKKVDYQAFGIHTEPDLKWFIFLIDQRYQTNLAAYDENPPVIVKVGGPKEEEISQPGSIDG